VSSIGRYTVERELGRGAMGVVYLAQDPHLRRPVAVKTYSLPDGITDELATQFRERFLREARAAASLSHPGIVTVYDAGEDPARHLPFIAMEYVPGETLKQRLEKGTRLDPAWVLSFGAVLADALLVAHKAGIVHRDIKPANILIREGDGAVKIADFGVARLKDSELTRSGASIGSPGYMSPEQVRGAALDGRSDLFSLAVVLYEALCGKRPFHGEDLVSLAYSIAHDTQVPLARQLESCPPGLDKFFDRALSKDPAKRFPDGAAFHEAFQRVGLRLAPNPLDRTVADADTVASVPAAERTQRAGIGEIVAVPPPAGFVRAGRRRLGPLTIAAVALVTAGLATAAYLGLGRATLRKAGDRDARVAQAGVGGAPGQPALKEETPRREAPVSTDAAGRNEKTERPTSADRREGLERGTVSREVEPVIAPPQIPRMPPNIRLTVPAGTSLRLTLDAAVSSSSSREGDTVTAKVTDPIVVGDRVAIPAGSRVHGQVKSVVPAKKGLKDKGGSLSLVFDRIATPSGFIAPMSATVSEVASGSGKKTAGIIGGSAAGGALLGKVLGGRGKNAAVGTLLGGAIGAGVAAGTKGQDVDLPAGSPLALKLDQPLTISVGP